MNRSDTQRCRVLFSGTVSHYSGAREAMKLMQQMSQKLDHFEGVMIGQVHDPKLEAWLTEATKAYPKIQLVLSR